MGYREPAPASGNGNGGSGRAKTFAWTLVALSIVLIAFLAWHQTTMILESRRYGIEESWPSSFLTFLVFGALVAGGGYAALKRHYGIAIALGAFVVALLGFISLLVVGGVGT